MTALLMEISFAVLPWYAVLLLAFNAWLTVCVTVW